MFNSFLVDLQKPDGFRHCPIVTITFITENIFWSASCRSKYLNIQKKLEKTRT